MASPRPSGVDVDGARESTRAMIRAAGAESRKLEPQPKPHYRCEHCGNTVDAVLVEPIIQVPVVSGVHVAMRSYLVMCEADGYAMKLVGSE